VRSGLSGWRSIWGRWGRGCWGLCFRISIWIDMEEWKTIFRRTIWSNFWIQKWGSRRAKRVRIRYFWSGLRLRWIIRQEKWVNKKDQLWRWLTLRRCAWLHVSWNRKKKIGWEVMRVRR
jgi:hypothetical protein